ncbi:MAG TPA: hypothetical protein VHZ07_21305 [Bryobacteraceae bacterium]|jgi:hypothetical protein|nr:hypothetical protein [Bryobacteraceae bacterium]
MADSRHRIVGVWTTTALKMGILDYANRNAQMAVRDSPPTLHLEVQFRMRSQD